MKISVIVIGVIFIIVLILEGFYFINKINKIPEYIEDDCADALQCALHYITIKISNCRYFKGLGDCEKYNNLCIDNSNCKHKIKQIKKLTGGLNDVKRR